MSSHALPRSAWLLPAVLALLGSASGWAQEPTTRGIGVTALDPESGNELNVGVYRETHALVIGIDAYSKLGSDDQLNYAVADATGVASLLRDRFQFTDVSQLLDTQATRRGILTALDGYKDLQAEDALFVFWAGHGDSLPGRTGDDEFGQLIPHDGHHEHPYDNVSFDDLLTYLERIPAKHVFVVIDACFGGLLGQTRDLGDVPNDPDRAWLLANTSREVRLVLTAGTEGQRVLDGGPDGHSLFTGHLLMALRESDTFVVGSELAQEVRRRVIQDSRSRRAGHLQEPAHQKLHGGNGDFVFVPKERSTRLVARTPPKTDPADELLRRAESRRRSQDAPVEPYMGPTGTAPEQLERLEERREAVRADCRQRWAEEQEQLRADFASRTTSMARASSLERGLARATSRGFQQSERTCREEVRGIAEEMRALQGFVDFSQTGAQIWVGERDPNAGVVPVRIRVSGTEPFSPGTLTAFPRLGELEATVLIREAQREDLRVELRGYLESSRMFWPTRLVLRSADGSFRLNLLHEGAVDLGNGLVLGERTLSARAGCGAGHVATLGGWGARRDPWDYYSDDRSGPALVPFSVGGVSTSATMSGDCWQRYDVRLGGRRARGVTQGSYRTAEAMIAVGFGSLGAATTAWLIAPSVPEEVSYGSGQGTASPQGFLAGGAGFVAGIGGALLIYGAISRQVAVYETVRDSDPRLGTPSGQARRLKPLVRIQFAAGPSGVLIRGTF